MWASPGFIRRAGTATSAVRGDENLCDQFEATGRDANGGYAELMTVPQAFAHAIPDSLADAHAAPLCVRGAIGFRSPPPGGAGGRSGPGPHGLRGVGDLVLKLVRYRFPTMQVFVFARSAAERAFARELGATWAGDTGERARGCLHAIIDTTPAWTPVVKALENLESGGRLVINAIRKVDADKNALLGLDYPTHLWLEKEIKSVANVTRADVREFLALAAEIPLEPVVQEYELAEANRALVELKRGDVQGAKVLRVS